jgi:hypothetical protein
MTSALEAIRALTQLKLEEVAAAKTEAFQKRPSAGNAIDALAAIGDAEPGRQVADRIRGYADAGDFSELFNYLVQNTRNIDVVMASFVVAGDALDQAAMSSPDDFTAWFDSCPSAEVKQALRKRPKINRVVKGKERIKGTVEEEEPGIQEAPDVRNPTDDPKPESLRRREPSKDADEDSTIADSIEEYAEASDIEGLFRYLVRNAGHLKEVVASFSAVGDIVDRAAMRSPEEFVGWFDRCPSEPVRQALRQRTAIDGVVQLTRRPGRRPEPEEREVNMAFSDQRIIAERNGTLISTTPAGAQLSWALAGMVLFLGDPGFGDGFEEQRRRLPGDYASGTVTVSGDQPGGRTLAFTGCPPAKQERVRSQVEECYPGAAVDFGGGPFPYKQ